MRTFLAVEVPHDIRKKIHAFIETQKQNLPIKWVAYDNLHVTLQFLGEIDEKKKKELHPVLHDICKNTPRFSVRLEGLGCFPSPRNPRVLWIGMKEGSQETSALADALAQNLVRYGFKEEKRFHPHLTIGRIKTFCSVDDILAQDIVTDIFEVDSLKLFKSTLRPEGPLYEVLEHYSFALPHGA